MADIEYRLEGRIAVVTLNRPEKANAFTTTMVHDWAQMYREAQHDTGVSAVLLTGSGSRFCAGIDLSGGEARQTEPMDRYATLTEDIHQVALAARDLDKPLVAAVNGAAYGAGLDMALMCDVRTAADTARFAESYVRHGLVPGDGGAYYLPRIIGQARALEMLLGGEPIDAATALEWGLVSHVFATDRLVDQTLQLLDRWTAGPPQLVRTIVRAVRRAPREDLTDALRTIAAESAVFASTHDAQEVQRARSEGREPRFTGR